METNTVKVASLHIENVKAVKAVHMELSPNGLTVIGGKNRQGKTSVLDAIAWTLGGAKFTPSNAKRDGSMSAPLTQLTLSNGYTVERSGKSGTLKVTDPTGAKSGQALLDNFISQFALDLPKFLNANAKDKAQVLLNVLGISDQLSELERREKALYDERTYIGRDLDTKKKYAEELPQYADAPLELVSAVELVRQHEALLAKNGENQRLRNNRANLEKRRDDLLANVTYLRVTLEKAEQEFDEAMSTLGNCDKSVAELQDESTAEIEQSLETIEDTNAQVRANQQKEQALEAAEQLNADYKDVSNKLDAVRKERMALLDNANLPLSGLTVENGCLQYQGKEWDCMSGAEQLKVATAIVHNLNPKCGFVLVDKLEQMDLETMAEFSDWAKEKGLQIIATRVSTGGECTIVIEDGLAQGMTYAETVTPIADDTVKSWGEF